MTASEKRIGENDRLLISYSISCEGRVLEKSEPGQPVEYPMGAGVWPIQIELAMFGEPVGKELGASLAPGDNAFGPLDPERIISMRKEDFQTPPETGQLIEFELENGEHIEGQVLKVAEEEVEVDFNHPYAGRALDFQIKIIEIL